MSETVTAPDGASGPEPQAAAPDATPAIDVNAMTFSQALAVARQGLKVARPGMAEAGVFVMHNPNSYVLVTPTQMTPFEPMTVHEQATDWMVVS